MAEHHEAMDFYVVLNRYVTNRVITVTGFFLLVNSNSLREPIPRANAIGPGDLNGRVTKREDFAVNRFHYDIS